MYSDSDDSLKDTLNTCSIFARVNFTVGHTFKKVSDCLLLSAVERQGMIWQHKNVKFVQT